MSFLSKTLRRIFLRTSFRASLFLGCFVVFSLSCEAPNSTHSSSLPQQKTCGPYTSLDFPQGSINPTKEPLFHKQWYLCNTGTNGRKAGIDINIVPVWAKGYGTKPISVGILDTAIDITHPDLTGSTCVDGFTSYDLTANHGTKVAGILAARDNNIGIIGVAPRACIYSYNIFSKVGTDASAVISHVRNALLDKHTEIAVYNASMGDPVKFEWYYTPLSPEMKKAMDKVTENGFGGKGSSFVFAAGNSGGTAFHSSYLNHYATIAVNSIKSDGKMPTANISPGATWGVNLWITAPSNEMTTTDNGGKYIHNFGRTSGATPLVSGAIALLRSEYPDLTWRDVKLIVAESADKYYDDTEEGAEYQEIGTMHSSASRQQYSRRMGFGLLDVSEAFDLAERWTPLPTEKKPHAVTVNQDTPFEIAREKNLTRTVSVTKSNIRFIESVTIELINMESSKWMLNYNFKVMLTSPDNHTTGYYLAPRNLSFTPTTITLLFNSFLGSSADGRWQLQLTILGNFGDYSATIESLSLTFRGH